MGRPKGSKNKNKKDAPKRKYTRRAPVAARGGNRSGAGRKSAEVHFAGLNAKIDLIMATMGLSAPQPVVPVAPVSVPAEASVSVSVSAEPKKRGPGRPRKIVTPTEVIVKEPTRKLPDDPVVTMPAPVFAAPIPVAPLAPPFAAQAAPVQAPVAPVVFAPPPPVQAQPGFIAVAPVQIAQPLPVQPTANGAPDFDAQFNALPGVKPAQ
jgi:hypothetical protein